MKTKNLAVLTAAMFTLWTIVFIMSLLMTTIMYWLVIATGLCAIVSMHKGNPIFVRIGLLLLLLAFFFFILTVAPAHRAFTIVWEVLFGFAIVYLIIRMGSDKARRLKQTKGEKCNPKPKSAFILPITLLSILIIMAALNGFCLGDLAFILAFTVSSYLASYIQLRILSTE